MAPLLRDTRGKELKERIAFAAALFLARFCCPRCKGPRFLLGARPSLHQHRKPKPLRPTLKEAQIERLWGKPRAALADWRQERGLLYGLHCAPADALMRLINLRLQRSLFSWKLELKQILGQKPRSWRFRVGLALRFARLNFLCKILAA